MQRAKSIGPNTPASWAAFLTMGNESTVSNLALGISAIAPATPGEVTANARLAQGRY